MVDAAGVPDRRGDDPKFAEITSRIDDLAVQHAELTKRFDSAEQRQATIIAAVQDNTEITKRIETSTSGLVGAWDAISGGLKVLNVLGKIAKWVTYFAGMIAALYAAWSASHGGPTP